MAKAKAVVEESTAPDAPTSEPERPLGWQPAGLSDDEQRLLRGEAPPPAPPAEETAPPAESLESAITEPPAPETTPGETPPEPPAKPAAPDTVPTKALLAERGRRQEAERLSQELQAEEQVLREEVAALREQSREKDPNWDEFGDLTSYTKALEDRKIAPLREELTDQLVQWKARVSEELARDRWDDYDEVMTQTKFHQRIRENPALRRLLARKDLPAFAAYTLAKRELDAAASVPAPDTTPPATVRERAKTEVIEKVTKVAAAPRLPSTEGVRGAAPARTQGVTLERAAAMTMDEYNALPPAERQRLLRGG